MRYVGRRGQDVGRSHQVSLATGRRTAPSLRGARRRTRSTPGGADMRGTGAPQRSRREEAPDSELVDPMPLSWNEIRDRANKFSKEWAGESSESAEAKTFWNEFFEVFGRSRRRAASYEYPVKGTNGKGGFIDLLWKGVLLVEHKSLGKDLDRAFHQATDYFNGLKERDL